MSIKDLAIVPGNKPLYSVLGCMSRIELESLYSGPLGIRNKDKIDVASDEGLRHLIASEILSAAKNSLMIWKDLPPYDEAVRLVADRIKVGKAPNADISAVERAILFKIVEMSIEKMSSEEKEKLRLQVENELKERGVYRKVTLTEILDFTKFIALDFSGTIGGIAVGAPGFAGMIGFNVAQLIVLKGIIVSSGYMAAGGALLGFGAGGAMLAIAGAIGPIGAALGVAYTIYALAGPAFRKLIPVVCVIAAKRIEISAN